MLKNFRTYKNSLIFYKQCKLIKAPRHLKCQLLRASSSVVLNLSEGSQRFSPKDQRRFYNISLSSLRECESIFHLLELKNKTVLKTLDLLSAQIYKLIQSRC